MLRTGRRSVDDEQRVKQQSAAIGSEEAVHQTPIGINHGSVRDTGVDEFAERRERLPAATGPFPTAANARARLAVAAMPLPAQGPQATLNAGRPRERR